MHRIPNRLVSWGYSMLRVHLVASISVYACALELASGPSLQEYYVFSCSLLAVPRSDFAYTMLVFSRAGCLAAAVSVCRLRHRCARIQAFTWSLAYRILCILSSLPVHGLTGSRIPCILKPCLLACSLP